MEGTPLCRDPFEGRKAEEGLKTPLCRDPFEGRKAEEGLKKGLSLFLPKAGFAEIACPLPN